MVRRSVADRSPPPTMYEADYEGVAGEARAGELAPGESRKRPRSGTGWRGAGGRWLVWTFRVVVWVILLVIGYRGVMAIVLNETPPANSQSAPAASAAPGFPAQEASAYALHFGQVYLNASPATASQRASDLASFLPPGASDPQFGWNGGGSLRLQSEQVAGVQVQDAQHAIVTLLARVNGKLMELGVPVYAAAGGMAISGEPAWLPAPKTVAPPAAQPVNSDDATQSALMRQLPAFFAAYASGDQSTLGWFLAPGTTVTALFLFTDEIIRLVQVVVLAVAIAVIFYIPSIEQTLTQRIAK